MKTPLGKRKWAIAEGYIPGWSVDDSHELVSHEALCILNTGSAPAHVELTLFFKDRQPVGPYRIEVGAQRTLHVRTNDLKDPEPVPRATAYSCVLESDVPIVVQHTRLDTRTPSGALMTTIAFSQD